MHNRKCIRCSGALNRSAHGAPAKYCSACYLVVRKEERRERKRKIRRANGCRLRSEIKAKEKPARVELHDAHVRALFGNDTLSFRWRYRNDPEFRIKECLRRQLRKKAGIERIEQAVRSAIHGRKIERGAAVERLLGYSMAQLKLHLERQFTRGMTWDNYGKAGWHIDHILPKRCFDLTADDGIVAYWSLSNLRPLWAHENHTKKDRVLHLV